jgi:hypothetical protein
MYIKGDWMQFATTVGLCPWNDGIRPCHVCIQCEPDMYMTNGITLEMLCWHISNEKEYFGACDECEQIVMTRHGSHRNEIAILLREDKRQGGSRGRALVEDVKVNRTQLMKSDRIEPSSELPDVGQFDDMITFPISCILQA